MKILVPVKRVIDPYVKIRVKDDATDVECKNVKMAMNPFDEIAVEEAVRLKEKDDSIEIILVSIGDKSFQETLRHGLALGACRAIHVEHEGHLPSLEIAKILKSICEQEEPDLVLMGKQAIDGDNNQTAQMLSALLDWPQATNISELNLEENTLSITREVDGGLEKLSCSIPAILSTDLRLNEPRYASLPNIMKAKRKPMDVLSLEQLSVSLSNHQTRIKVEPPPVRKGGIKVESVDELLDKLIHEAKVIKEHRS